MGLWMRAYGVQINSYYLQQLVNLVSCSFCEWRVFDLLLKADVGQQHSSEQNTLLYRWANAGGKLIHK